MGNWNSGPPQPHGIKRTVESCYVLSTTRLKREGYLESDKTGQLVLLTRDKSRPDLMVETQSRLDGEMGKLLVDYQLPKVDGKLGCTITLSSTMCRFGGCRWWLHCPMFGQNGHCQRRSRKLYLGQWYFGCRQCQRLTYKTTQCSDRRVNAIWQGRVDLRRIDPRFLSINNLGLLLKFFRYQQERTDHTMRRLRE